MAKPIYSTSVVIDQFKGLNQTGDGANASMRYAVETENVNVHNGSFSPMRKGKAIPQELDKPIGTLAYLSRRYITNPDTLMVAVSDGKVYTKQLGGSDDWVQRYSGLTENDCDWLTYESGDYPVFLPSKKYAVGERCKHAIPPEPPEPVLTSVRVFYNWKAITVAEDWKQNTWRALYVCRQASGSYSNVVPIYSDEETYGKGETCAVDVTTEGATLNTYKIYNCTTTIEEPETFNPDHWSERYTISEYSNESTYAADSKVILEDYETPEEEEETVYKYYKCTTAITTPAEWDETDWEEISTDNPVDILLFTNAKDGMYCLYGDTLQVVPVWVTPDPENNPEENIKFGVIARYNERIWGSGIDGDPDKLMYSVPFTPFDWTPNFDIPEDGAGDILQPTWDGDSFVSLHQLGSDLMAIKRNSIWRIYGTNPGEFVMTRQYGGGTIQENTVAVQDQYMYMLGEHGMLRYDGIGAYAFLQDAIHTLMADNVNLGKMDKCCAAMRNGIYCLALPMNGSEYCNAVLEFDPAENTFAMRTDISVDSFLQVNERLFYTSATEPGKVIELRDDVGLPLPCKWVSGYQDLNLKNSIKSAFILYMMVECEAPVELRVGIRTEKKFKQKIIYTKPNKMTRLHLNTQGRIFRLEIVSYSGIPFTIAGGVKMDLELDPD